MSPPTAFTRSCSVSSNPPDFRGLTIEILRRAIDIYLSCAYPSGTLPEAVQRRLSWPDGVSLGQLLEGPPFEQISPPDADSTRIYALRLGNLRYPHMKFQVQAWPTSIGYMLSVNTHDQILGLDANSPDAEAFRALQAENQRIKESVEQAWDEQGFPTFLRYLRDYISAHPADGDSKALPA